VPRVQRTGLLIREDEHFAFDNREDDLNSIKSGSRDWYEEPLNAEVNLCAHSQLPIQGKQSCVRSGQRDSERRGHFGCSMKDEVKNDTVCLIVSR